MASDIDIANRALIKLGSSTIISFLDNSKAARAINSMYYLVRDAELRANNWNFSIKRAALPALTSVPAWGFGYEYQLPADCLKVLQIGDTFSGGSADLSPLIGSPSSGWKIEGRVVRTDCPAPLNIRYISNDIDSNQFDSLFIEVLACRLEIELSEDLTQSNTKKEAANSAYKAALVIAIRNNATESPPESIPDNSWLLSRI